MKRTATFTTAAAMTCALLGGGAAVAADSTTVAASPAKKPYVLVRSKTDTVMLIQEGDVENILSNIGEKIDMTRRRGYGGAGGPTPGLMLMDMGPVRDVVTKDAKFRGKGFDIPRYQLTTAAGGMGYGGIGNGIRIGGGGFGGSQQLISRYTNDDNDSVAIVEVDFSYGGFLVEKCIVNDNMNTIIGGMMGGGSYTIKGRTVEDGDVSAFEEGETVLTGEEITGVSMTLYGGATYTLISWFHVGADLALSGFFGKGSPAIAIATGQRSFYSMTPSIRLRIMFGNLG